MTEVISRQDRVYATIHKTYSVKNSTHNSLLAAFQLFSLLYCSGNGATHNDPGHPMLIIKSALNKYAHRQPVYIVSY